MIRYFFASFLVLIIGSLNLSAAEEGVFEKKSRFFSEARDIAYAKFSNVNMFEESSAKYQDNSKEFLALMKKVSDKVSADFKNRTHFDGFDSDSCSSSCVREGTNKARTTLAIYTLGKVIDLSPETRKCQQVCMEFMHKYHSYQAGVVDTLSLKKSDSPDCTDVVANIPRGKLKTGQGSTKKENQYPGDRNPKPKVDVER